MYHQSYLDGLSSQDYEEFLFWSGQISRKPLDNPAESGIIAVSYTHLTLPTIYSV